MDGKEIYFQGFNDRWSNHLQNTCFRKSAIRLAVAFLTAITMLAPAPGLAVQKVALQTGHITSYQQDPIGDRQPLILVHGIGQRATAHPQHAEKARVRRPYAEVSVYERLSFEHDDSLVAIASTDPAGRIRCQHRVLEQARVRMLGRG